jgi:hypothetical protein
VEEDNPAAVIQLERLEKVSALAIEETPPGSPQLANHSLAAALRAAALQLIKDSLQLLKYSELKAKLPLEPPAKLSKLERPALERVSPSSLKRPLKRLLAAAACWKEVSNSEAKPLELNSSNRAAKREESVSELKGVESKLKSKSPPRICCSKSKALAFSASVAGAPGAGNFKPANLCNKSGRLFHSAGSLANSPSKAGCKGRVRTANE